MTACSNSRRHGAVVAALVGAMSLGAPAVALATTGGIDVLAVSWNTGATVSKATDGKGTQLTGDLSTQELAAGEGRYLLPTQVTNANGDATDIGDGYTLDYYKKSEDGTYTLVATTDLDKVNEEGSGVVLPESYFSSAEAGTYYVKVVKGSSGGTDATGYFVFKLVGEEDEVTLSLKSALTYNGSAQTPVFVDEDGSEYTTAAGYTISYQNSSGSTVTAENLIAAGTYYATVKDSEGNEIDVVTFTIDKYDITSAALTYDDVAVDTEMVSEDAFIEAVVGFTSKGLSVTKVVDPSGRVVDMSSFFSADSTTNTLSTHGTYTVTLTADGSSSGDTSLVSGSKTVTFSVVDTIADLSVYYDGSAVSGTITVDLTKGEQFDSSKVTVKADGTTYSGDDIELTFKDSDGNEVDAATVAAAGTSDTFTMTVRLVPQEDFETGALTGGTATVDIVLNGSEVDADENVAFYLDGELAGEADSVTYDGTDQLERLTVSVKADGKEYVEGTDYTVEVKNSSGKVVTEAVDAGTYTVTVTPVTFTFAGGEESDTFTLTIDPVDLSVLVPETSSMLVSADSKTGKIDVEGNEFYVAYTGSALEVPAVSYEVVSGSKYSYVTLDSSLYNVVSVKKDGKVVSEVVDEGDYTVTIALTSAAGDNYVLGSDTFTFTVKEFGHFADVDSAKWYSVVVEKAYDLLYINGMSGTNLYAPEASMTRADAICVLFNMAGGQVGSSDYSYSETTGYVTGFSDVNGNEYFAKALAWAKASGIANGDTGTTNFRPYDTITRQEFAALLANFAKSKGDYVAPSSDALDAIEDADTVSAWATEVVSWAVENGVMGNKGYVYATSDISRAEVAAMAVNYQPENLLGYTRSGLVS